MTVPGDPSQTLRFSSPPNTSLGREGSWTGSTDAKKPSPTQERKRDRDVGPSDVQATRKGRACLACRKLKVKCDSLDRGDDGCSRCQRLDLTCVTSKRLRLSLDEDGEHVHPSLARLDRAVEDILSKLKMPPLESYTKSLQLPEFVAQTTRENSCGPPAAGEHDMAEAPMGSLFEVTQLNTLGSRPGLADSARYGSKRKTEVDLISRGIVTEDEAEEMLVLFKNSLSRYLYNATVTDDRTLQSVRESSILLFTAIMVVASLHMPGKEKVHNECHKQLRDLVAASMFDPFHTLEDIRALCIAAFWLPDLSWKLSGHCIRMATELNLHQAFYKAFYSQKQTTTDREQAFERARLWYLLYVLDHHFSIAYGRPPATTELQAIRECEKFLNAPECTASDRRVLSQVTLFIILHRAYDTFGLEAERLIEGDENTMLIHARYMEELLRWRQHFRHSLNRDVHIGDYPAVGADLHYHFASLMLNSLALRGRSLVAIGNLPMVLRPLASNAIESAHRILQIVLDQPNIRDSLVGVPLYLHTMIAFAVVFLVKTSSRWRAIDVTTDPETRTRPLIEGVIRLMQGCKAGSNHILYSMAAGFARLMKRNFEVAADRCTNTSSKTGQPQTGNTPSGIHMKDASRSLLPGQSFSELPDFGQRSIERSNELTYDLYGTSPSLYANFGGWQTEDEMLWSNGMGYDLLANNPELNGATYSFPDMLYPATQ